MKKILIIASIYAVAALVACSKDDGGKPELPTTVAPVTTVAPPTTQDPRGEPVVGLWCSINEADFSPCNPNTPKVGETCTKLGEKRIGCKSVECKKSCI